MNGIGAHVICNAITNTRPRHHKTTEAIKEAEMETNMDEVAAKLELLGFDPIEELVAKYRSGVLSPQQEAALARWLLPFRYPQKKAMELTSNGGPLQIQIVRFADSE